MPVQSGSITVSLKPNSGEIWRPADKYGAYACAPKAFPAMKDLQAEEPIITKPVKSKAKEPVEAPVAEVRKPEVPIEEAPAAIEASAGNEVATQSPFAEATRKEPVVPIPVAEVLNPEPTEITPETKEMPLPKEQKTEIPASKSYEEMTIEELQQVILEKMAKNGPVTDYMKKTVYDNTHHGSLVTWARSF